MTLVSSRAPCDVAAMQLTPIPKLAARSESLPSFDSTFRADRDQSAGRNGNFGVDRRDWLFVRAAQPLRRRSRLLPDQLRLPVMAGVEALKRALDSSVRIEPLDLDGPFYLPLRHSGLALCLGILYHLKNPYRVLETLAAHSS